jgi:hypothetical protein
MSSEPSAPFNRPFYLILNLAVGGNWPGNIVDPGDHTMLVDYVKVEQLQCGATEVCGDGLDNNCNGVVDEGCAAAAGTTAAARTTTAARITAAARTTTAPRTTAAAKTTSAPAKGSKKPTHKRYRPCPIVMRECRGHRVRNFGLCLFCGKVERGSR